MEKDGEVKPLFNVGENVVNMDVLPNGNLLVGQFSGLITEVDPRTYQFVRQTQLVSSMMSCVRAHPVMPLTVATTLQSEIVLCDTNGVLFQSIKALEGFRASSLGHLESVALHPLDTTLACYNSDGIVFIYHFSVCSKHAYKGSDITMSSSPFKSRVTWPVF